ncbi:MAG: thioredoxin [Firmicutes bacterium]|nr:thioredoxin [Bacillota bacterium]
MEIKNLTTENFDEAVSGEGKVLVDFWASWCGPCKQMGPVLEEIAAGRDDITIAKVNVDEEPELARRFQVRSIPYFGLFENGQLISQTLGAQPKSSIEKFIEG